MSEIYPEHTPAVTAGTAGQIRSALEAIASAAQGSLDTAIPLDREWVVSRALEALGWAEMPDPDESRLPQSVPEPAAAPTPVRAAYTAFWDHPGMGETGARYDDEMPGIRAAWDAAISAAIAAELEAQLAVARAAFEDLTSQLGEAREVCAEFRSQLETAVRENDAYHDKFTGIRERLEKLAAGMEMSASTTAPSKKSEIETGCAAAVRQIAEAAK